MARDRRPRDEVCVSAFIYNPRVFRRLVNILKNYGIKVNVPANPSDITRAGSVILVDEEGLEVLSSIIDSRGVRYYVISDDSSIYRFLINVFGIDDVKVFQIGIDIGSKLAYVILCDYVLLKAGYVSDFHGLIKEVEDLRSILKPVKTVVKVGITGRKLDYKLSEFIDLASGLGYEIYIIDEHSSSNQVNLKLRGMKSKLPIDVYAALNMVFRDGIRVVSQP